MIEVKRAILSVSDKTGLVEFGKFLADRGVDILSTGGTLTKLKEAGIVARPIDDYTGFPEMMDGRLKTLHPKIHGGLLALLDNPGHTEAMEKHGIGSIDLLVVNLYPFAATVAKGAPFDEVIENIDIGGPTMLRASSKNYRFTAAVCDPTDYGAIMEEIQTKGGITPERSLELARKVFNHTASYDAMIAGYLNEKAGDKFPENLTLTYRKVQPLRYGENPHQEAAFYRSALDLEKEKAGEVPGAVQLQGKELSFNNMLDFSSALGAAVSLPGTGVVIVKHLNPCGASIARPGEGIVEAFLRARETDPVSAFGGVIAFAGEVDEAAATAVAENFVEGVIAPSFTADARKIFEAKKNVRLMEIKDPSRFLRAGMEIRQVAEGILYEDLDVKASGPVDWKVVTAKQPTPDDLPGMEFAWRLVKSVKSNAIVFTSRDQSLGIGAGQMSRVDSVEIAVSKAKKSGLSLENSIVASDAFFPFRDGLDVLVKAGARIVIQPGGSVRDQEVIDAATEQGVVMVFTGMRHFRH